MVETKRPYVINIQDYLADLGLEFDRNFEDSIFFARIIQNERREKAGYQAPGLSRTSVLLGAAYANKKVKNTLKRSGLTVSRLLEDIGIPNFEPPDTPPSIDLNVNIHFYVALSIFIYASVFENRKIINAPSLIWGLFGIEEGTFINRVQKAGGDPKLASELLSDLITSPLENIQFEMPQESGINVEAPAEKTGMEAKTQKREKEEKVERTKEQPPQPRLHRDRWASKDELGYDPYAEAISRFIIHENTKPPLVVGIQAPWGQGKTTLMRMIQRRLDSGHPDLVKEDASKESSGEEEATIPSKKKSKPKSLSDPSQETEEIKIKFKDLRDMKSKKVESEPQKEKKIRSVWFNAWKYQNSEQIWAGLAHCIISQLSKRLSLVHRQKFMLRLQLRRVDWDAVEQAIHAKIIKYFVPRFISMLLFVGAFGLILIPLIKSGISPWVIAGGSTIPFFGGLGTWTWSKYKALSDNLEGKFREYVTQPDYSGRLGFLHLVEEDMMRILSLLTDENHPALIFVDDLDRCSPKNVAEIIEAINLFLAGDFPNCIFILGLDAEVVAASMEVAHEEIISKLSSRRDELGWRFMDKFIQLPFVIPRLTIRQGEIFLGKMFETSKQDQENEEQQNAKLKAEDMIAQLENEKLDPESVASEIGKISESLQDADPNDALKVQHKIIEYGVERYQEDDPRLAALFDPVRSYLTDNPRTIKRVVNLFRFHYFTSIVRMMQNLPAAEPKQLARWAVLIVRWPHFVRWIQAERTRAMQSGKEGEIIEPKTLSDVIEAANAVRVLKSWVNNLNKKGIKDQRWINDQDLFQYLKSNADSVEAGKYGLW
jgi:hypothetical protein